MREHTVSQGIIAARLAVMRSCVSIIQDALSVRDLKAAEEVLSTLWRTHHAWSHWLRSRMLTPRQLCEAEGLIKQERQAIRQIQSAIRKVANKQENADERQRS